MNTLLTIITTLALVLIPAALISWVVEERDPSMFEYFAIVSVVIATTLVVFEWVMSLGFIH